MAKYTEEQLNTCSKEMLITLLLSMQDQMEQLNKNFEKLVEQLATANNQRYGRSSEKLSVIDGQLSMDDLIFNEAEALTDTTYVIEPTEEQVLPKKTAKQVGKRKTDLKDLPVEVISHEMSEDQLVAAFGSNGWNVFRMKSLNASESSRLFIQWKNTMWPFMQEKTIRRS